MENEKTGESEEAPVAHVVIGEVIKNLWKVKAKLGEGSCGSVWLVSSLKNERAHAAMKVEPFMKSKDDEILKMEVFVLKKMQKSNHFCRIYLAGRMSNFSYVIMSLLGRNISDLRSMMPPRRFTTGTSMRVGLQALQAIQDLHTVGFVHRDVKPGNFSLGSTQSTKHTIFIFDFGLARQFLLPVQGTNEVKLREPRRKVVFRGTVRYCSANVHCYKEQGRHDDLISLLYMVVELITGDLPWKGMSRKESGSLKQTVSNKRIFRNCPKCFSVIYTYLKSLGYKDTPDYSMIHDNFNEILQCKKITMDSPYDWEKDGRYYDELLGYEKQKGRKAIEFDERVEGEQEKDKDVNTLAILASEETNESGSDSYTEEPNLEREDTLDDLSEL